MLCCYNGCGQVCTEDTRVRRAPKRGTCPRVFRDSNAVCTDECASDYQCPGLQKCCNSECGRQCTMPCFHWLTRSSLWRVSPRCGSRATNQSPRRHRHSWKRNQSGGPTNPWLQS
ncbi:WAP four-disulfide core domain protein 3 [Aplysia californica]|uniref:WAP four-disulfide core domain protein 3 n=1 Tax=Aplysia californica TaxID=6500 RepID=A0ABM0ZWX1_APLCA|nr:WAP four-disulfide core domain protein 3 [Aplysia californica]